MTHINSYKCHYALFAILLCNTFFSNPLPHDPIITQVLFLKQVTTPLSLLRKVQLPKKIIKKIVTSITQETHFQSFIINKYLYRMHSDQSLDSINQLWKIANRHFIFDNEQMKKELCILILLLYRGIYIYCYSQNIPSSINNTINYEYLNNQELNALCALLNIITQEIKPLIETMQIIKTTTWKEWLSTHWKGLMVVSIVIALRIALHQKSNTEHKIIFT